MRFNDVSVGQRTSATAWFILANGLFALLVGLRYLPWISLPDAKTTLYAAVVYFAQFPLLALLAGLPLLLLAAALPNRRSLAVISVTYAALGIALLTLDTLVFSLYRFHLSAFVLEMATAGGSEIFSFSWQVWARVLAFLAAILLVEAGLAWLSWRHRPSAKWLGGSLALVFVLQATAHGWHAWADAHHDTRITSITRPIPLYYAATAKRFFNDTGLVEPQSVRDQQSTAALDAPEGGEKLNYPISPLECTTPERKLNVLMIVIDGARWDMLQPQWMPNIHRFAQQNLTFENHFSNGNATKPGLFSLLYSLPASYWDAFTATKTPPVVISRMQALDYQTKILGSATLISPAFDKNAFSSIPDLRLKTPGEESWDRDIRITDDWLAFTESQDKAAAPFFGVLFYDTPHNHRVPDDYPTKFQPYWESVNKVALDQDFNPELIKNNYKSTLHFVDNQVGRVLEDLRSRDLLDNTIVMITGDHGQEFNEYGKNYWGHGSNFGEYQLHVPMVVNWPGKARGTIAFRTENFDVAPSLMSDALGCEATPADHYASGNGLFQPKDREWSLAHSYMDYALLLDQLNIVTHASGDVDVVNSQLESIDNYTLKPSVTREVLSELSRFYK